MRQFLRGAVLLVAAGVLAARLIAEESQQLPVVSVGGTTAANAMSSSNTDLSGLVQGVGETPDAAREIAGLAINDAGARGFGETTTLRGLGNTPFFSGASAPVYLDEIPLASGYTVPAELFDFSEMTVYRGPQSAAMFGRAGDAGVIQFTSPVPGASAVTSFNAQVGSYGARSFSGSMQTARGPESDAAVYVGTGQRDGYIYNTQLKETVDRRNAASERVELHFRPTKNMEVTVEALGQQARDGADALVPLGGPYYTVSRGKEGVTDTDFAAVAMSVAAQLDDVKLTATTSYTDWNMSPYSNRLVLFGDDLDSVLDQSQKTFNEEIRIAGTWLTGGAFYSRSRTDGDADRTFGGYPYEDSSFTLDGNTVALFGRTTFQPAAEWNFTIGLRLEQTTAGITRIAVVPAGPPLTLNNDWDAFLPSVSVTRDLGRSTEAAFTLSRGFKPGGYSAYADQADLAAFGEQITMGAEAAISRTDPKSSWSATMRAFAYRVNGYQIERTFAVPNTAKSEYLVVNAKRARVLGLEMESAWKLAMNWSLRLAAGLTDVTLRNFTDPFTGIDYSGDRAPYVPTGNVALHLDYGTARGFFCGTSLTWTGRTFYDEQETASFSQPAYALLGARAGFRLARCSLQIFGRNLMDKAYYSGITPGVLHGTPGAPLTWGGEFNERW